MQQGNVNAATVCRIQRIVPVFVVDGAVFAGKRDASKFTCGLCLAVGESDSDCLSV